MPLNIWECKYTLLNDHHEWTKKINLSIWAGCLTLMFQSKTQGIGPKQINTASAHTRGSELRWHQDFTSDFEKISCQTRPFRHMALLYLYVNSRWSSSVRPHQTRRKGNGWSEWIFMQYLLQQRFPWGHWQVRLLNLALNHLAHRLLKHSV